MPPRIVEFSEGLAKKWYRTRTPARVPATLSVNREARDEALLHYRLIFHGQSKEYMDNLKAFYFFSFEFDALYLPAHNIFQTLQAVLSSNRTRKDLECVKWIILDEYSMLLHYGGPGVVFDGRRLARLLRKCRGLQGFTIRAGMGSECPLKCGNPSCRKIVRLVQPDGAILPAPKEEGWFEGYVRQCLEDIKQEHPNYRVPDFKADGRLGRELLGR